MPDVGVLQLTIKDNSEQAGQGLSRLSDALVAVKNAVSNGLGLEKVESEVVHLAKTIQDAKGTSTIVKNLGTMFNAINKFSSIKSFSIDTEKIRDMAQNMLKLADAKDRVEESAKSGAGVSDWRSTMMGGLTEGAKNAKGTIDEVVGAVDNFKRSTLLPLNMQLLGGKGRSGFSTSKEEIQEAVPAVNGFASTITNLQEATQKLDLTQYIVQPIEVINELFRHSSQAVELYSSGLGAALNNTESMAAKQKAMADSIRETTKEISGLITYLDKKINYKGLSEIVNVMTGVTRGASGDTMINASTTMFKPVEETVQSMGRVQEATAGTISVFDSASGSYKQIYVDCTNIAEAANKAAEGLEKMTAAVSEGTSLMDVPASGVNGAFANANEEFLYLTGQIDKAKADMQQFADIAAQAQKQLKYGGPVSKDELTFNLEQSTEGFYKAIEAEEAYQEALRGLMRYITSYVENTRNAMAVATDSPMTTAVETLNNTAKTAAEDGCEELRKEIEAITESTIPAVSKIELLRNKINELWGRYAQLSELPSVDEIGNPTGRDSAMNNTLLQIGRLYEQLDKVVQKSHEAQQAMQFDTMKSSADTLQRDYGQEMVKNLVEQYTHVELLELKLRGMEQALADDINQNKADTQTIADKTIAIQNLRDKIKELKQQQEETTTSAFSLSGAYDALKDGIKKMFPTITGLLKSFVRMAKMRAIRYVIRQIAAGFKEGIENVYNYSKAINGTFAPSMDGAASSLAQMKNALGASLAPLLQMLIPIVQSVINWFINLINYVNQFFALINGQKTWTRALPQTTEAFSKQEKAAKSAGAAIKDLLADWDELNIIQSETGGGMSGAGNNAAEDYLKMFEEVGKFDNRIKNIVKFITDNFDTIKKVAEAIGVAILGWKISKAFGSSLSMLQTLELAAGITLVVTGLKLTADAGYDIGKNGINGTNALEAVGGVISTMLGGGLVGLAFAGVTGGVIGLLVGGSLSIAILAIKLDQGHLDSLYGQAHKDADEIRDELEENILTAEAKLEIDITDAALKDISDAETKVTNAINDLAKTYPVGVELDPGDAEDFKGKVDALVDSTNALIGVSKGTMKELYVPATAEFSSTFIDDAWDSVSEAVTYLGKKIGEELSKGISDNTRLEDLKKKLLDLTNTVVNAQMSSEFAGSVGLLGGKTRSNTSLGMYDRETISNYVKEYNSLVNEKMGEATGRAKLEYTEATRLVASLEASIAMYEDEIANGGLEPEEIKDLEDKIASMTKELDIAKKELDTWNNGKRIAERAKEIFDSWTSAGRTLYEEDITGALSMAMDANKNYKGKRNLAMAQVSPANYLATDDWVDQYLQNQRTYLESTIAAETGMSEKDIKELLENTGINPLSFFDQAFVEEYRNKIISWLSHSTLLPGQKQKILAAFGLDLESLFTEEEKKVIEETKNLNNHLSTAGIESAYIKQRTEEIIPDKNIKTYSPMEGDAASEMYRTYLELFKWGMNSKLSNSEFFEFDDMLRELFYKEDQNALTWIKQYMDYNTDIFEVIDRMRNYTTGQGWSVGGAKNAARYSGGMGISDVGWTPRSESEINGVMPDERDFTAEVANGTAQGNADQNEILNTMVDVLRAILRKDVTVNLAPSSSFGSLVGTAVGMMGRISGNEP